MLNTDRLSFRQIAPADAPAIFDAYAADPEVSRYLTWRPHRSLSDTDAYIAHCLSQPRERSRTYVLAGLGDGRIRGAFDLRRATPYHLGYGYVLARRFWGQGLMTEALTAVVRWGLAEPTIFRVGDVCDVDNIASFRVMEKAGMTREGTLRRWGMHPNIGSDPRDRFSYAIVR